MSTSHEDEIVRLVRQACPDEDVPIHLDTPVGQLGLLNSIRLADLLSRLADAGYPEAMGLPTTSFHSPRTLSVALATTSEPNG